ncbi:MAG: hypothetical protein HYV07_24600 [Deltaproteobacteria bacterium]|nr:hypothetical protein [Deltaproteobacteria bacterium]
MTGVWLLGSAIAALAVGPLFLARLKHARLLAAVDGFVLGSIGSLVLARVLPDALARGGSSAVLAAVVGMALPLLADSRSRAAERGTLFFAVVALTAHAALDGAALTSVSDPGLAVSVVLHRVPSGLFVFWMIKPRRLALLVLGLDALATTTGFYVGERIEVLHGPWSSLLSALVAGSLLHVVAAHGPELVSIDQRHASAAGAALGVLLLLFVPEGHEHGLTAKASMDFIVEAAPLVVVGIGIDLIAPRVRALAFVSGLGVLLGTVVLPFGPVATLAIGVFLALARRGQAREDQGVVERLAPVGMALVASSLAGAEVGPVDERWLPIGAVAGALLPLPLASAIGLSVLFPGGPGIALVLAHGARGFTQHRKALRILATLGAMAAGWGLAELKTDLPTDPTVGLWAFAILAIATGVSVVGLGPRRAVRTALGFPEEPTSSTS